MRAVEPGRKVMKCIRFREMMEVEEQVRMGSSSCPLAFSDTSSVPTFGLSETG